MLKPKFRIGDKVKTCQGVFKVTEIKKQEAVATHAIKVRSDGSTSVSLTITPSIGLTGLMMVTDGALQKIF